MTVSYNVVWLLGFLYYDFSISLISKAKLYRNTNNSYFLAKQSLFQSELLNDTLFLCEVARANWAEGDSHLIRSFKGINEGGIRAD